MSGLLDFTQAASNAVASNVSGPVDLLALALRKLGVPVPEDPIAGAAWMEKNGFTKHVKQGASQVLGETAGLLAPMGIAAKAPQIAKGLLQAGDNLAAQRTLNPQTGAIVYHGSPHKFDAFDSSKIGTGEGAQAYGHGLYLADTPEAARYYKTVDNNPSFIGQMRSEYSAAAEKVLDTMNGGRRTLMGFTKPMSQDEAIESLIKARQSDYTGLDTWGNSVDYAALRNKDLHEYAGNLYKVDLPDEHIARMLDWDKPLSQQAPEVQKAIEKNFGLRSSTDGHMTGEAINDYVSSITQGNSGPFVKYGQANSQAAGGQVLRQAGIPGIRYLDSGSRGAGQGTSNYVVFPGNEGLLSILERNGVKP